MTNFISKSDFKKFQQCSEYFWFDRNRPDVLQAKELNDFEKALAEQGKIVEQQFYLLYPDMKTIASKGEDALEETRSLEQRGALYISQAAFAADGFFAQSDLLHFRGGKHIDLYEIKSGSSSQVTESGENGQVPSRKEYFDDLSFQYLVASKAGYEVDKTFLVELNKDYTRRGDHDLEQLFNISDVTIEIKQRAPAIEQLMLQARLKSTDSQQPVTCKCKYKSRKNQCPAFPFLHPEMTGYTVHDLANIGKSLKRLKTLVDSNIFRIEDIPADHDLTDSFRDQILSWNQFGEIIRKEELQAFISTLEYPMYFLDYETFALAVPLFDGTRPYQQIPFQYSLHIIHQPGGEPEHREFLHTDPSNPIEFFGRSLRSNLGDTGSVIVWNKSFEGKCNACLADALPELAEFLLGINRRFFDLMEVISRRMYVHKDFRGRYTIKKVLPVLVPELNYSNLVIGDGGTATSAWGRMVFESTNELEKQTIEENLLEYCKLDTLAMVEIYKKIYEKLNQ